MGNGASATKTENKRRNFQKAARFARLLGNRGNNNNDATLESAAPDLKMAPDSTARKFPFMTKTKIGSNTRNSISPELGMNLATQPNVVHRSSNSDLKQFTERRRSNIIGSDIGLVCEKTRHRVEVEVGWTQREVAPMQMKNSDSMQDWRERQMTDDVMEMDPSSTAWTKLVAWNQLSNPFYKERLKRLGLKKRQETIYVPQKNFRIGQKNKDVFILSTFLEFGAPIAIETNESCCLCRNFSTSPLVECRVCSLVYHERCLSEKMNYGNDECSKKAMESAFTEHGWSCPECENLGLLLSEEETQRIIENFEQLQRPWSCTISYSDWLMKKRSEYESLYDRIMPERVEKEIEADFHNIDPDGSGSLSWMEFLVMESLKSLNKQPKTKLVTLLCPKEVARIRNVFARHDLSGSAEKANGVLNEEGAFEVYHEWLQGLGLSTDEKKSTITSNYSTSNLQTWQPFLLDKVLCILAARPNGVMGGNYVKYAESLKRYKLFG